MKRGAEWTALTVGQAVLDPREDDFRYYVSCFPNSPPDFRLEARIKGGDTVDANKNGVSEWALRSFGIYMYRSHFRLLLHGRHIAFDREIHTLPAGRELSFAWS